MNRIERIMQYKPVLSDKQAHIFLFKINLFDVTQLVSFLSKDEQSRAEKLKIENKRNQFVITRGLLRVLLSSCLQKQSEEIVFSYAQHGKPYISDKVNNKPVEFNISHSGDYALIALTLENQIGVDIEEMNQNIDCVSLSSRFFSEQEKCSLSKLSEADQLDAFFRIWTRKESFIKAVGKGVAFGLDNFSVPIEKAIDSMMKIKTNEAMKEEWNCYDLIELDNYKTALTVSRKNIEIIFESEQ